MLSLTNWAVTDSNWAVTNTDLTSSSLYTANQPQQDTIIKATCYIIALPVYLSVLCA